MPAVVDPALSNLPEAHVKADWVRGYSSVLLAVM